MSADVIMLHKPGSVDVGKLKALVAQSLSSQLDKPLFEFDADPKQIAQMIRDSLSSITKESDVTAGLYVGFRVIDGKTPKVVLRWRSYDNRTFWDEPKKFRSRRLARVWAKRQMRECVPSSITFRPVTPLTYITCEFLVTKADKSNQ